MAESNISGSQYFYRNATFTRENNQVALIDIRNLDNKTSLDDWLGVVVSLADGRHTVDELMQYMASQYTKVPANLEQTIHSVLKRLQEGDIVQLSETPVELPYYLAQPIEALDLAVARMKMLEDGYQPTELN